MPLVQSKRAPRPLKSRRDDQRWKRGDEPRRFAVGSRSAAGSPDSGASGTVTALTVAAAHRSCLMCSICSSCVSLRRGGGQLWVGDSDEDELTSSQPNRTGGARRAPSQREWAECDRTGEGMGHRESSTPSVTVRVRHDEAQRWRR